MLSTTRSNIYMILLMAVLCSCLTYQSFSMDKQTIRSQKRGQNQQNIATILRILQAALDELNIGEYQNAYAVVNQNANNWKQLLAKLEEVSSENNNEKAALLKEKIKSLLQTIQQFGYVFDLKDPSKTAIHALQTIELYLNHHDADLAAMFLFMIRNKLPKDLEINWLEIYKSLSFLATKPLHDQNYKIFHASDLDAIQLALDRLQAHHLSLIEEHKQASSTYALDKEISELNEQVSTDSLKVIELESKFNSETPQIISLKKKIIGLERERQIKGTERLRQHASNLSQDEIELGYELEKYTGVLYAVKIEGRNLKIVGILSATILGDGTVLTSAHSLLPVFDVNEDSRVLLFFVPRINFPKVTAENTIDSINKEVKQQLFDEIHLKLDSIEILMKQSALIESHKKMLFEDETRVELPHKEEIEAFDSPKDLKYAMFLIQTLKFPAADRHKDPYKLPGTLTKSKLSSNTKDDMAICQVTNQLLLPQSSLKLMKFSLSNVEQAINKLKSPKTRLFVACSIGAEYFFTGGNRLTTTNDIEINFTQTLSLPIPTRKGCSAGALIAIDKIDLLNHNFANIYILGIVFGFETQLKKEGTGNYCIWMI